jgi:hypothetical protein
MTTTHVHSPSRVLSLMAACAVPVVALLAASTAHADPADADAKYLAALSSRGITYASPEVMIAAGHVACTELDQGETPGQVAQDVMNNKDVLTSSNLDAYHAGFFVGASIAAYCPEHAGRI